MKRTNRWKKWMPVEDEILRILVAEGLTVSQMTKILVSRTHKSIIFRKKKLGLYTPRKLSSQNPLHVAEIVKFKMAGWNLKEIAHVYGCSVSRISKVLTDNGIKGFMRGCRKRTNPCSQHTNPCRLWTSVELRCLRACLNSGYCLKRIYSEIPQRTSSSIRGQISRMKRCWSELEIATLRKYLVQGYSSKWIQMKFPHRSTDELEKKQTEITRYWFTPEQKEARRLAKEKEWQWRVW